MPESLDYNLQGIEEVVDFRGFTIISWFKPMDTQILQSSIVLLVLWSLVDQVRWW